MRYHVALTLSLTVAMACSQTPRDEPARVTAQVPPMQVVEGDGPDAPVLARWRSLSDGVMPGVTGAPSGVALPTVGETLQLAARVEYQGAVMLPVTLDIRLPRGVSLERGSLHRTLPVAPPGTVYEEPLTLRFTSPPTEDLVMVIDARSPSWGVHGEVPYRLSRREPVHVPTSTPGAPVVLDGHLVAPTVRIAGP